MRHLFLCLSLILVVALSAAQPVALPPIKELNECERYFADLILFFRGENVSDPNVATMWFYSGKGPQDVGSYDDCQDLPYAHFCVIDYLANGTLPLKTGICWPKNCTADDLRNMNTDIAKFVASWTGFSFDMITVAGTHCAKKGFENLANDWRAIVVICLICFLAFLAVLGGILEYCYLRARKAREMRDDGLSEPQGLISINDDVGLRTMNREVKKPLIIGIIMCWSPISNLKKLVQPTSVPHLSSLNALRVFSMFWVLLGHACYWAFWTIGFDNVIHVMTVTVKHWTSSVIVNATLSVDSFFYMSGFLVAYLGMKELYKKGRMNMFLYYFHRFWRLSPPYLLALIFLWHVLPYLGSGPWWVYVESYSSRKNCADYWWTNVLYINNFWPRSYNAQCMGWSWYLANDFQMYAISPIFLFAFYKSKLLGILLIDLGIVASLIASGAIAYANDFSAYALDPRNIEQTDTGVSYEDLIYDKFYIRIPVYFVGMLAAFVLLELEKRKIKRLTWWQIALLNIVAFTSMGIAVFGSTSLYANLGTGWTQLQTVMYITFSRLLFGIGIACFMHMFYMGHNYLLRKIFEWHIWSVMARLTFSTYLWHPILMSVYFFNQTTFAHYSVTTAASWFFTFIIGGFGVAIFGFLLVERPLMNLEKFLMPGAH